MMKRLIIAISLMLTALMGCEQTVNDVHLPYEEKLVVQSMLDTQDSTIRVFVGRTIPPVRDTKMSFWVDSADVFITIDGVEHKLQHYNDGKPSDQNVPTFYFIKHLPKENATYHLRVQWKNHTATASTTVPSFEGDVIDHKFETITKTDELFHYIVSVDYTPKEQAYVKFIEIFYTGIYMNKELFNLPAGKTKNFNHDFTLYNDYNKNFVIYKLAKYDPQYLEYYESQENGDLSDDPFSTSGLNRMGNIKGDGIGYFYSRASRIFKYDN